LLLESSVKNVFINANFPNNIRNRYLIGIKIA
jgi:hypothetical protein